MLERYITGVIRWHKMIVIVVILTTTLLAVGVDRLIINHDVRAFLNPDDSILLEYDDFQRTYGPDNNFFIVVVPADEDVFTSRSLSLIRDLGVEARDIPYFNSVTSVVENPYAPASVVLRDEALADPLIRDRLVASDGRAAAVKVTVALPDNQPDAESEALAGARAVVDRVASAYPDSSITLAGNIAVSEALAAAISRSVDKVTIVTSGLILLMLVVILRNPYTTIATLLVMALSVNTTMGIIGWLGIELTAVAGFIPAAIAAIAVADSIHLLVGYHASLDDGEDKLTALRSSFLHNAKPVFLTSLTSILGVLTLNFSDAPPYRDMGNMIAAGVAMAFVMSLLLWPALMAWFPQPRKTPLLLDTRIMSRLGAWVVHRHKVLILIVGALSLALISQAWRNSLNERWVEYLGPKYEARLAMDTVARYFGGIHHVYYSLDSGRPDGVFESDYLEALNAFAEWNGRNDRVDHVASLVDVLQTTGHLSRKPDGLSVQPVDVIKASLQYSGLTSPEPGTNSILSADNSASIMEVTYVATDSAGLISADDAARAWLEENAPQIQSTAGLGLDLVFSRISLVNIHNMLKGATIALVIISLLLVLLMRSLWLGLASLVPNLVPIGLAFGVWGLTVGHISMAASVVMGISLGLVVDDTVHFLCKYEKARSGLQRSPAEAVSLAYGRVATAIVATSVIMGVGMSGALSADITPTRETAVLMITTIGFAMLADLFLLPPLLIALDRRKDST